MLIVEDLPDSAELLSLCLSAEGHEVFVAYNGTAGISKARELRPDVVVCDLGLPDVAGFVVAQAIRREPGLEGCLLVAVTGNDELDDESLIRQGFDRRLLKPVDPAELAELIARERRPD